MKVEKVKLTHILKCYRSNHCLHADKLLSLLRSHHLLILLHKKYNLLLFLCTWNLQTPSLIVRKRAEVEEMICTCTFKKVTLSVLNYEYILISINKLLIIYVTPSPFWYLCSHRYNLVLFKGGDVVCRQFDEYKNYIVSHHFLGKVRYDAVFCWFLLFMLQPVWLSLALGSLKF